MPAVTLMNSFDVPTGREDQFLQFWKQVNAYMQKKPGYIGHKLHRAITPDAPFRFVNVARWSSMAHYEAAHDAGFRELVNQPAGSGFVPHPILYEVVHEAHAATGMSTLGRATASADLKEDASFETS